MALRELRVAVFCLLFVSVSCGRAEPLRISDGSEEAFHASVSAMERSLSNEERAHFYGAILRIRLTGIGSAEESRRVMGGKTFQVIDVRDQIKGLTYTEILELSELSGVKVRILGESAEPLRIDGESEETFRATFSLMEKPLTDEERTVFLGAIFRIALAGDDSAEESKRVTGSKTIQVIDVRDQINGLTYAEILELSKLSGVEAGVLK